MHLFVVWVNYTTFSISDDGCVVKQNLWKTDSRSPFFANNERFGFKDPNETKQQLYFILSQAVSQSCCFVSFGSLSIMDPEYVINSGPKETYRILFLSETFNP